MRTSLLALLLAVAVAACGDDDGAAPTVSATADRTMLSAGEHVILTITVTGFQLVDPGPAPPNASGQGHYHVYLDAATGSDYLVASAAASADVVIPDGTSPGAHTLRVELEQNDHTPVPDAPSATVAITILAPAPTLAATATSPVTIGGTLTIDVTLTNFVLDAASIGSTTNVPGRGHYHINVDGAYQQLSADDPSTWTVVTTDVAPGMLMMDLGTHTLTISLQNNDHSDLAPPITADITVVVE